MSNINNMVSEMLEEGWGKKLALGAGLAAAAVAAPAAIKYGAGKMAERAYDRGDQTSVNRYQDIAIKASRYDHVTPALTRAYLKINPRQLDFLQRNQTQVQPIDKQAVQNPNS